MDLITHSLTARQLHYRHSEFDIVWYSISPPAQNQCSTSCKINLTLCLNAFRGEPASSWFDWHFTPNLNSSADFSTSVGSDLHVVLPTLHPGQGQITKVRVYRMLLNALFRLAFAMAPDMNSLTLQHKITRRLILQQARHHTINSALTDCKLTVSGSISLSFSLFFSPFHHCTRSLSVTDQYLALPDGPGGFRQGFTCPALLGILTRDHLMSLKGLSPAMAQLPSCLQLLNNFVTLCIICKLYGKSHNPICTTIAVYHVHTVQALPISLAATFGIIRLFSFRPVTKMFQFTGFPSHRLCIHLWIVRF